MDKLKADKLTEIIGADFYTGVPDSQLRALCDYLMSRYGVSSRHHMIAANEGNCVGLAAGYYLATGKVPVIYLQNSGEGNIINPVASLLNENVYAIPVIFIVGWRGEPGNHDEPQHIYQGKVTLKLLEDMNLKTFVIRKDTSEEELKRVMEEFRGILASGRSVAFVVCKGAISFDGKVECKNGNTMVREEVIRRVAEAAGADPIISTTGKASRELFEIRTGNGQGHQYDFLTVGSMGHSSSIALGVALNKPNVRVWCIDGDGAVLMHMGAMAVIGASRPENMVHIVINNGVHESVGGMPTVADQIDLAGVAKACGYPKVIRVSTLEELECALRECKEWNSLSFIEAKCAIGTRDDLGRPTTSALENKENFMRYLESL